MGRRDRYRSIAKGEREGPGCMSEMLQFFDFHHILSTPSSGSGNRAAEHSSPQLQHHYSAQHKGVEAPRNSLELDEAATASTASNASAIAEEYYGIPIGIQLTTTKKKKKKDLLSLLEEEKWSSQCETPRTPNIVARLMGLEILPDGASTPTLGFKSPQEQSPRVRVKKKTVNDKQCYFDGTPRKESPPRRQPLQKRDTNILPLNVRLEVGSRSLPDTPRASAKRSRDADPRLSLQLNDKENNNKATYLCEVAHSLPPSPTAATGYMNTNRSRRKDGLKTQDENKSPRNHGYAKETVKQVKESIHRRRSGNASSSSSGDENVVRSRRTRPTDKRVLIENESSKHFAAKAPSPSTTPVPPQTCFFEPPKPQIRPNPPRPPQPPAPFFKVKENVEAKPIKMEASKCKRASYERFTERIKRQPPPSETATQSSDSLLKTTHVMLPTATRKEDQKNLLSCEKIKNSYTTVTSSTRREASSQLPSPSPQGTRSVSTISTQEHKQRQFQHQRVPKEQDAELIYVRSILDRAGILSSTQVRWYSPSLPIDPFVFHQLELDLRLFNSPRANHEHGPLHHRCNRKLLFHLVEEILVDLLSRSTSTPATKQQRKQRLHEINKELLLDRVWSRIRSFPLADCQVIDDIDALVAGDLAEATVRRLLRHPLVAAEAEGVALEIEEDVLDSVIGEAAAMLALCPKL